MKNNKIVPFNYGALEVRTVMIDGEPWFVAKDVCKILGLQPNNIARDLDYDEFANSSTRGIRFPGVNRGLNLITEPGLYSLIQKSRKQEAMQFKRWVNHEVLPTIRKTGGVYMTEQKTEELLADPDLIIGLAMQVKAIKAERDEAIRTKAHVAKGREGTLMSKVGLLTQKVKKPGCLPDSRCPQWRSLNGLGRNTGTSWLTSGS